MHCPKCGTENPDAAQLCSTCGSVLTTSDTGKPVSKPKTSRLAIASFLLGICTLFLFLIAGLPSIVLGIVSLFLISKSAGKLKGKPFAIAGITISVLLMSGWYLWSLDAPPIPNDYTIADLRSAPPDCNPSYELLMNLSEQEYPPAAPKIGLTAHDVNVIAQVSEVIKERDYSQITLLLRANEHNINGAWNNAKKGRHVISKLNTFPQIADLREPDLDAEIRFMRNLRLLVHLYKSYVCLEAERGNSQSAVNELIELDSVFRKLSVNARSTTTKLACIGGLANTIITASFIVNTPQTSTDSLQLLAQHFKPLTKQQISLRNSVISEYLTFKKTLDTNSCKYYCLPKTPCLKRNSTLRLYKNYCANWIDVIEESHESKNPELSVWPSTYPNWIVVSIDSEVKVPWIYRAYNPIGSILLRLLIPVFETVHEVRTKLKVQDDLFQIVLNKRLGKQVSLKARAYSDEYIIDVEGKRIFSPGPDGEPNTTDDIKLPINPQVVGFSSR